jgi:hypothetical protein
MEFPETTPIPLSMFRDVAPETVQERVVLEPSAMEAGEAEKLEMVGLAGPVTVTVTAAVTVPPVLYAESVYVVVAVGETDLLVPETLPTPWSMLIAVALLTFHVNTVIFP